MPPPRKTKGKPNVIATRPVLREVTREPLEANVALIRRAYRTVADDMGITPENAPRYTAFITPEQLGEERDAGGVFYGLFLDGAQAGFVAVQQDADGLWHMRRLAVLPEYRRRGLGRQLVERAIAYARERGATKLHIGIVAEQKGIKQWYEAMGFRTYRTFTVPHLPFSVALLAMRLDGTKEES
jgi:GNAT superfamily N-acetyltransferase